MAEYTCF